MTYERDGLLACIMMAKTVIRRFASMRLRAMACARGTAPPGAKVGTSLTFSLTIIGWRLVRCGAAFLPGRWIEHA